MYGNTINKQTYMTRTANHSTKGNKRGYCDIGVIVDKKELLENPNEVKRKLNELEKECVIERLEIESEIANLRTNIKNWRKNLAYKYKGKEHLLSSDNNKVSKLKRYFYLGDLIQDIKSKHSLIGTDKNKAFVYFASQLLDKNTFDKIMRLAEQID